MIIRILKITVLIPWDRVILILIILSRKSPRIPPPNIPAMIHHISSALCAFISRSAKAIPAIPQTTVVSLRNLTLVLSDGSEHEFKGSVDFIDRSIDPRTGSILIQSSFPNPRKTLRPGQFARVLLEFETVENALLVPQRCITELQGEQSVFVVDADNRVEFRQVDASVTKDGLWLIESGLEAGERVIFEGLQKARSGIIVKPLEVKRFHRYTLTAIIILI